jgi:hypothetical protein
MDDRRELAAKLHLIGRVQTGQSIRRLQQTWVLAAVQKQFLAGDEA